MDTYKRGGLSAEDSGSERRGFNQPEQITEDFLTCPVCLDPGFRSKPKILSCGHTICQPCLEPLERDSLLSCPCCGHVTDVSRGGVACLTTNVFIDSQIDQLLRRHNKARGRDDSWYNIPDFNVDELTGHASF